MIYDLLAETTMVDCVIVTKRRIVNDIAFMI